MGRLSFVGIPLAVVTLAAGCNSPVAPSPQSETEAVHVTGRVLAYSRASEFSPIGGAQLFGWIEGSGSVGRIPLTTDGRFDLTVPRGSRVRLYAGGTTINELYQPCAVTVVADGNVTRDVRIVEDYSLIGATVPPAFLEGTRILSGTIYEAIADGGRRPVPFATVSVGGYREYQHEIGWPIANTRTDADGRYVICGLEGNTTAKIYVYRNPIQEAQESIVELSGDTVLDIELPGTESASRARSWMRPKHLSPSSPIRPVIR
jgi:hypothetical protein